jgi:hypothetical protein
MHLIIKRHQPCYLAFSCLLPSLCLLYNLSLKPCCASKIYALIPTQICLQAYLKVFVKSITHLLYHCWSPSCSKFYYSTFLNSSLNSSICCSPQIYYSFQSFVLPLLSPSLFHFFYNGFIHGFFFKISKYSANVTTSD